MAEPIAAMALIIEAAIGWPNRLHAVIGHPVGLFAKIIRFCDLRLNRADRSDRYRRIVGLAAMLCLIASVVIFAILIETAMRTLAQGSAWPLLAILAWPAIAARSLDDHVRPILTALETGDLPAARYAVSMIVGRDTSQLDEAGVSRAAIESLAESFCDGVVAPLFWLFTLGLPGAWALKSINTADSMIGHREEPYRAYGWAAARIDDLAMLIPARLSGFLLCLSGGGWRVMIRDHNRHASPNAGWPESAIAGALNVRLAGPIIYDGTVTDKPWIGTRGHTATPAHLRQAITIYRRACVILGAIAMGAAWLV